MKNSLLSIFFLFVMTAVSAVAHAHALPLNRVAVDACEKKEKSEVCQYSGHHNDLYIGTCQLVTEAKLICVRNKPIQKRKGGDLKPEVDGPEVDEAEVDKPIDSSQEHTKHKQPSQ